MPSCCRQKLFAILSFCFFSFGLLGSHQAHALDCSTTGGNNNDGVNISVQLRHIYGAADNGWGHVKYSDGTGDPHYLSRDDSGGWYADDDGDYFKGQTGSANNGWVWNKTFCLLIQPDIEFYFDSNNISTLLGYEIYVPNTGKVISRGGIGTLSDITSRTFSLVSGCTNPTASNYNSSANLDDGSCTCASLTEAAVTFALNDSYHDGNAGTGWLWDTDYNNVGYIPSVSDSTASFTRNLCAGSYSFNFISDAYQSEFSATITQNGTQLAGATCGKSDGAQGDQITCNAINFTVTAAPDSACADADCTSGGDTDATCSDVAAPGTGFTCSCSTGYEDDGTTCTDIDECANENPCDTNATCINSTTPGGPSSCECNDGYDGSGLFCTVTGCTSVTVVLEDSYPDGNSGTGSLTNTTTGEPSHVIDPDPDNFGSMWSQEYCLTPGSYTFNFESDSDPWELTYTVKYTSTDQVLIQSDDNSATTNESFLVCAAGETTLGTTSTTELSDNDPTSHTSDLLLYPYEYYSFSRSIYYENEIGPTARPITSLSVYVTSSYYFTFNDMKILMRNIGDTASLDSDYPEETGYTPVFVGDESFNTTGWHKIDFTTPFDYDGSGNLEVIFKDDYYGSSGTWIYDWNIPKFAISTDDVNTGRFNHNHGDPFPTSSSGSNSGDYFHMRFGSSSPDQCPVSSTCAANEHVVSGECVSCGTGYSNGAGDAPADGDTDCDEVACADENSSLNTDGLCVCNDYYDGDVNWNSSTASWVGECALAPCPENASGQPSCQCGDNYYESESLEWGLNTDGLPAWVGTCSALTVCNADEYETQEPTATDDRECATITNCEIGTYVSFQPTATDDRECADCDPGTNFSNTQNADACTPLTVCSDTQYESASYVDAYVDRVCADITNCEAGSYVSAAPTDTSNRECAECNLGTNFSNTTNAEACTDVTTCGDGLEETAEPTLTTDRQCGDINGCAGADCTSGGDTDATCGDVAAPGTGFTCSCSTGYNDDGTTCADIDECATANPCVTDATCANSDTAGNGPSCTCPDGDTGDGFANGSGCTSAGDDCINVSISLIDISADSLLGSGSLTQDNSGNDGDDIAGTFGNIDGAGRSYNFCLMPDVVADFQYSISNEEENASDFWYDIISTNADYTIVSQNGWPTSGGDYEENYAVGFSVVEKVFGCTNPTAANYNTNANTDDASSPCECANDTVPVTLQLNNTGSSDIYGGGDLFGDEASIHFSKIPPGGLHALVCATHDAEYSFEYRISGITEDSSETYDSFSYSITKDDNDTIFMNDAPLSGGIQDSMYGIYFSVAEPTLGCTNSSAENYDIDANVSDNNSCVCPADTARVNLTLASASDDPMEASGYVADFEDFWFDLEGLPPQGEIDAFVCATEYTTYEFDYSIYTDNYVSFTYEIALDEANMSWSLVSEGPPSGGGANAYFILFMVTAPDETVDAGTSEPEAVDSGSGDGTSEVVDSGSGDGTSEVVDSGSGDGTSEVVDSGAGDGTSEVVDSGAGDGTSEVVDSGSGDGTSEVVDSGSGDGTSEVVDSGSGDGTSEVVDSGSGDGTSEVVDSGAGDGTSEVVDSGAGDGTSEVVDSGAGDGSTDGSASTDAGTSTPEEETDGGEETQVTDAGATYNDPCEAVDCEDGYECMVEWGECTDVDAGLIDGGAAELCTEDELFCVAIADAGTEEEVVDAGEISEEIDAGDTGEEMDAGDTSEEMDAGGDIIEPPAADAGDDTPEPAADAGQEEEEAVDAGVAPEPELELEPSTAEAPEGCKCNSSQKSTQNKWFLWGLLLVGWRLRRRSA